MSNVERYGVEHKHYERYATVETRGSKVPCILFGIADWSRREIVRSIELEPDQAEAFANDILARVKAIKEGGAG